MTLDAGVKVDVDWHGGRAPLPADIDLSAFRIIQEASPTSSATPAPASARS